MWISNEPQEVPVSEPIPFCLGPFRNTHAFLLISSDSIYLLGWDFLEKHHSIISFSQKEDIISIKVTNKVNQMTLWHSLCLPSLTVLELILETLIICPYWISYHLSFGKKSPNDVGKIHSTPPIKIQIEGFPGGAVVKNPPVNAGDTGLSPGLGRSHMLRSN